MKNKFLCIFICLASFFLMSHNTFAVDFSYNVRLHDSRSVDSYYSPNLLPQATIYGAVSDTQILNSIKVNLSGGIAVQDGFLVDVPFYLYNYKENNSVDGHSNFRAVACGNIPCQIIGYDYSGSSTGQMYHIYIYVSGNGTLTNLTFTNSDSSQFVLRLYEGERFYIPTVSVFRFVNANGSTSPITSNDIQIIVNNIQWVNNNLNSIYDRLGLMLNKIPSQDEISAGVKDVIEQQNQQDKDEMNNAINDANNSAENNTNQIENATGDTQASVQGIIDVVLNTGASDCKIDGDLGQVNLGELNMCSAPASFLNIINTVAGIVGVIVTVNVGRKVIYDVQEIIMRVTNG